jgi:hypothetical protein
VWRTWDRQHGTRKTQEPARRTPPAPQVRAASPILAGEEATACYLGESRLAPIRRRRAALRAGYGFHCQCARCAAEQRAFPTNWYPRDAAMLGLEEDGGSGSGSSGGGDAGGQRGGDGGGGGGVAATLFAAWRGLQEWFGVGTAAAARPAPSPDNFLLLELADAAAPGGPLAAEVQSAAAAPGARVAVRRRAAVLARAAGGRARLEAAVSGLPRGPAGPEERKWFLAAAFPWLWLEVTALELFLSGGALPSEADIAAAAAAGGGGARRGGWLARLRRRAGEEGGGASGATGPTEGAEQADAATRRALRARQLAALGTACAALDGAARGSERHVLAAVAALDAARALHGADSLEVRAAQLACGRAHAARYGPLAPGVLGDAVAARRRQLLGSALARRMSLLAWDAGEGV